MIRKSMLAASLALLLGAGCTSTNSPVSTGGPTSVSPSPVAGVSNTPDSSPASPAPQASKQDQSKSPSPSPSKSCCCDEMEKGQASSDSLYQLQGRFVDGAGKQHQLEELKGKIQVVALVYTHCETACPQIINDLRGIDRLLSENDKQQVEFLLVSIDPLRDKPQRLQEFGQQQKFSSRWRLWSAPDEDVRELANLLGFKYAQSSPGQFAHSNLISILDAKGQLLKQLEGLSHSQPELQELMKVALK